jgi:eukaryotic-like serine/threonine-protein kinase
MTYAFVVESGPRAGLRLPFKPYAPVVLGRGSGADLILPEDQFVSRAHARVEVLPDGVYIHDIADRKTTSVNGLTIRWARLTPGNVVRLGNTLLRLVYEGADGPQQTAGADDISMYEVVDASRYHIGPLPPTSSRRPSSPQAPTDEVLVVGAPTAEEVLSCSGCGGAGSPPPSPDLWDAAWLCPKCQQERRQRHPDVPVRIGAFEVLRPLHRGDYGHVLEAVSVEHGIHAVVKMLPASNVEPKALERFLREQRIVTTLRHPNIVRCYEVGEVEGRPFIVSEFLPDGSAVSLEGAAAPVHDMLWLGADLFRALGYAHDLGIVHRDVSPANVLLRGKSGGSGIRAKLADFGLAKSMVDLKPATVTLAGEAGGSMLTMSPEQVYDFMHVTPSADIYSAAATVFFLLTGETPLVLPCAIHDAPMQMRRDAIVSTARRSLGDVRGDLSGSLVKLLDGLLTHAPSLRQRMHAKEIAVALSELAERTAHTSAPARQAGSEVQVRESGGGEPSQDKFAVALESLREFANLLDQYEQSAAADVRTAMEANDPPRIDRAMARHQRLRQDLETVVARWEELRSLV